MSTSPQKSRSWVAHATSRCHRATHRTEFTRFPTPPVARLSSGLRLLFRSAGRPRYPFSKLPLSAVALTLTLGLMVFAAPLVQAQSAADLDQLKATVQQMQKTIEGLTNMI